MKITVVVSEVQSPNQIKDSLIAEINGRMDDRLRRIAEDQQLANRDLTEARKRQKLWQLPLKKRINAQQRVKSIQDRRRDTSLKFARERAELEIVNKPISKSE